MKCPECRGQGYYYTMQSLGDGENDEISVDCSNCEGMGEIKDKSMNNQDKSRSANLARLRALADDPTPENLRNLIALIENLWTGDGFEHEDDSDGTVLTMSALVTQENYKIIESLLETSFYQKFWTLERMNSFDNLTGAPYHDYEFQIPKEDLK